MNSRSSGTVDASIMAATMTIQRAENPAHVATLKFP